MTARARDTELMRLALGEARVAYGRGQLPIGAVLLIDDQIVSMGSNLQVTAGDWASHAESLLIRTAGKAIKEARKADKEVHLVSTLEPCLMCFGTAAHNRITRITYSCPDPAAGATRIQPPTPWYAKHWPTIHGEVLREESYDLFVKFMKKTPESWKNVLPLYEAMHATWK